MPVTLRELAAAAAVALTLYAFYPYILGILRGSVRPHVFSWVIWGATTWVVFLAALQSGGGLGAWIIGLSATMTLAVAGLAWLWPQSESITFFGLFVLCNLLVLAALENFTMATWLFPVAIALACSLLIVMIAVRRRVLDPA